MNPHRRLTFIALFMLPLSFHPYVIIDSGIIKLINLTNNLH